MPGFTLTPLVAATIDDDELQKQVKECLQRRPASPEEIAGPIVFLASQQASYMNAAVIEVSGGRNVTLNRVTLTATDLFFTKYKKTFLKLYLTRDILKCTIVVDIEKCNDQNKYT